MKSHLRRYLQNKGIDSFQKLQLLLFLYQNPSLKGTLHELAQRTYFGDTSLLGKILTDLHSVGLVEEVDRIYKLADTPGVITYLKGLARLFDDPLTRQNLLQALPKQASWAVAGY
ncbi:MAG: hypothetical protein H6631_06610 [Anaerolineaceae bacterium]|nr:hypothetical protein [Anaerolineaceae bacterium]MCB9099588.1 hypothetical protein [Anaerolineales bacterium]